jgi:NAD+ diphosphatase
VKPQQHLFKNADFKPDHVCFIYHDGKILMLDGRLPTAGELKLSFSGGETVFRLREGWAVPGHDLAKNLPAKTEFRSLREVFDSVAVSLAQDASLGAQLVNWSVATKYCSQCGAGLQHSTKEMAKVCAKCDRAFYPQLTPAVIVLVKRGREILLAKGPAPRKHYSCIAGFLEPGETLEECIRREVKEEVGVEIRNIRYFGSQPWPFPNNVMIGFTADWVAGDIKIDEAEITDAGWFTKDKMPELVPVKVSIARRLIEEALRT